MAVSRRAHVPRRLATQRGGPPWAAILHDGSGGGIIAKRLSPATDRFWQPETRGAKSDRDPDQTRRAKIDSPRQALGNQRATAEAWRGDSSARDGKWRGACQHDKCKRTGEEAFSRIWPVEARQRLSRRPGLSNVCLLFGRVGLSKANYPYWAPARLVGGQTRRRLLLLARTLSDRLVIPR
jgi:hypothetical protein